MAAQAIIAGWKDNDTSLVRDPRVGGSVIFSTADYQPSAWSTNQELAFSSPGLFQG